MAYWVGLPWMAVVNTIGAPSGDQPATPGRKLSVQIRRKSEPSGLTTKMPGRSDSVSRSKAMASPVGDQTGPTFVSGPEPVDVSCLGALLPSAGTVKSWVRPGTSVMRAEYPSVEPSGDHAGGLLTSPSNVS